MAPMLQVAGHDIAVSSLDKELFPDDHFMKGDMLLHYSTVADAMVPHLAGRPLTLLRFPHGIGTEGFFQKHPTGRLPEWVRTVEVPHRRTTGTDHYVVGDDAATLLFLANLSAIEFHIWTATVDDIERPDRLVVDIDPPSGVPVAVLRSIARRARDLFTEVGLTPYLQATGGRGYHVVAPLDRTADFPFVRALAGDLADRLAAADPDMLTTAQRKNRRGDRIFLDVNRNGHGQTFVAPYSLRARPGAAVATPLEWNELGRSTPNGYNTTAISRRLARKTDPWANMDEHAATPAEVRIRLDALNNDA
ncbi:MULTISPECIES: non-homologous end-joining DNA ligase [Glycomyces]|uniref:Bifunctional non-homologous end joining protein LigD n=2 Tax=Glycomyces TaxID=58113 RepID=A0A9X3SUV7_9ACTN|nr:non-homologous end-joining DNA ligase [Glycomyces lechevalierae]MDA1384032.1 non-homologous end-joining DNA ligase [Glycomyces lechevalierae]MDR7340973.1 bifunctional non-homologous end joining protein LigD [Glycomyces lechevalierae]